MKKQFGVIFLYALLNFSFHLSISAQVQVNGTIKDGSGNALEAVSINVVGTDSGTFSDATGNYSISANEGQTLRISYVGFKTVDKLVGSNNSYDIIMESDQELLDEVIVTGVFDARTRMESSVAISTLNGKQIDRLAAVSAADLLKNTPGVYVNSAAGEVRNTVYASGISANANTSVTNSNNGYYYVSLQEDGLPVTAISDGLMVSDLFFRSDASIKRLEAVRGGTSSITYR